MEKEVIVLVTGLSLFVYYFTFFMWFSFDSDRVKRTNKELGIFGLFYFIVPLFPLFYHYVIEHYRPAIKKLFIWFCGIMTKKRLDKEIEKLLLADAEVVITKFSLIDKNHVNPMTYESYPIKVFKITYRYNNNTLHERFGDMCVIGDGILADKLSNVTMPFYMTETELKLMIINNRVDNLCN